MKSGDYTKKELEDLYKIIPGKVDIRDKEGFSPENIAGCDVSYRGKAKVSCVVWSVGKEMIKEKVTFGSEIPAEYIPGRFAIREFPLIKEALGKISVNIDCLIVDGHGIAHPDDAGLACFCGVLLDLPTFGCAKNLLIGKYDKIKRQRGNFTDIIYQNRKVGEVVCTKNSTKPVYISPGHCIDFKTSREITLKLSLRSKYPEPLRLADINCSKT